MSASEEYPSDRLARYSQRSLVLALVLVLAVGAAGLAVVALPEIGARWMAMLGWMLPLAIAVAFVTLRRGTLRGARWHNDAPQVQAILRDEWRHQAMDRAFRTAFVIVLILQVPLALLLASLPAARAVMGMAVATSVLGLVMFLSLTLIFSRQAANEP